MKKYSNNTYIGYASFILIIVFFFAFKNKSNDGIVENPKETITVQDTSTSTSIFSEDEKASFDEPIIGGMKSERREEYIAKYSKLAKDEQKKYGVPASITLAQGILECAEGTSTLARENKNHFGIKCFSRNCPKGHCSNFTDDSHKDFFRIFPTVWDCYRAHSEFLCGKGKQYRSLLKHGTNYEKWARGLQDLGYATDKKYAATLTEIIETYNLSKYDK